MNLSTSNSNPSASPLARGAYTRYFAGFFLFILFLFLFDRLLFFLISTLETNVYKKNKFEKRFENYLKENQFSTLIFGTSRTYEGIHPYYFEKELGEKAFKESFQGKGPKYFYYFYQFYKKHAGIPKVVIYGVDYFIYNITSDSRWLARFRNQIPKKEPNYFSAPLLLLKYKKKVDEFFNNLLILLKEKENPDDTEDSFDDFVRLQEYTGTIIPNKGPVAKRPAKYIRQFFFRFPGKEGDYLEKLLEEMNNDNVMVILVGLPDYYGTYKTNFERRDFALDMKRLDWKYKNVFFYNYNRSFKFPLKKKAYFLDGAYGLTNSHLSKIGAEVFNKLLIQEVKKHY
jgi:hypothetical protein